MIILSELSLNVPLNVLTLMNKLCQKYYDYHGTMIHIFKKIKFPLINLSWKRKYRYQLAQLITSQKETVIHHLVSEERT